MKYFEVRDRATFIPVVAFRPAGLLNPTQDETTRRIIRYGLGSGGWPMIDSGDQPVIVCRLNQVAAKSDPDGWTWNRTLMAAHEYIQNNWDALVSGAVIDVECVLGEKPLKEHKTSEALN